MMVGMPFSWTGFYVGVNAGAVMSDAKLNNFHWRNGAGAPSDNGSTILPSLPGSAVGAFGGGQIGYNYQIGSIVTGVETDIGASSLDKHASRVGPFALYGGGLGSVNRFVSGRNRLDWLGTLRVRVGMTATERLLLYVTGGLAYGEGKASYAFYRTNLGDAFIGSKNTTRAGWTLGGGAEYAITQNWSVKAEALYFDLGGKHLTLHNTAGGGSTATSSKVKNDGWLTRIGVNYKF